MNFNYSADPFKWSKRKKIPLNGRMFTKTLNGRLPFKWQLWLFMNCDSFFIEFPRDLAKHYWSKGCDSLIAFLGLSSETLLINEL